MGVLKRIAFLLTLSVPVFGDQISSTQFKGLNSNESPVIIGPEYASDLLNTDVTPGGRSVKKRPGYGIYRQLQTGQPVIGGYHAFDSSGSDYQLWGSSTSLYSIKSNGLPVQLLSSATLNSTWDCTDTQGNSYCVNSNRDALIRTDGSTITWITSPLGTMIEATPDRVIVAGILGSLNTLFVSQSNTFTNFTVGVSPTDAFTEVIAGPGSRLTHIRWGCGKLLWWKDQSFGYFDFDDQFTAQVKTVSDTIGTIDNSSAIDPGGQVWFRGQDGHTWMYDCSFLAKESVDITPFATSIGRRSSNLWTQTSGSDFNTGSGVGIDTTTVPGQVSLAGRSDTFSDLSGWNQLLSSWTVVSNVATFPNTSFFQKIISSTTIPNLSTLGIRSQVSAKKPDSSGATVGMVNASNQGYVATFFELGGNVGVNFRKIQGATNNTNPTTTLASTTDSTPVFDTTTYHNLMLQFEQTTGDLFAYFDNTLVAHANDSSYTDMAKQYIGGTSDIVAGTQPSFQNPSIYSLFGTYYSAVHNAPNLTSWGPFSATHLGLSNFFDLRSSTNSFTITSATPAWTSQETGDAITISTGTYFQFKAEFSIGDFDETQASHILYDFTLNWFEGLNTSQAFLLYFDNAIWQSVAFGPGQVLSNYIFKYDLLNEGWTVYNFGTGGMLIQDNRLYFGDPTSGNVFKFGDSTSDNGTAINAFWKSKDYSGPDPFLQTQLTNIDSFFRKTSGTTVTSTYTMDTSTSTAYTISLSNATKDIIQSRKLLPSGKLGQVFNIKYSDTSDSSAWELLGYRFGFTQLPYRTTP